MRGLGGQIREMAAAMSMFTSVEAFRTTEMMRSRRSMVLSFEEQKIVVPRLPSGPAIMKRMRLLFEDTNRLVREVRASYGIMRVM